ncbi:hypothetical protein SLA2020_177480 [Shorea laevis]
MFFQMSLHHFRYTKEDYQDMPELKLGRLLSEYGLSNQGEWAYKIDLAMGAFLWPDSIIEILPHTPTYCNYTTVSSVSTFMHAFCIIL